MIHAREGVFLLIHRLRFFYRLYFGAFLAVFSRRKYFFFRHIIQSILTTSKLMRIFMPSNTILMMDRITTGTTFLQYVNDVTKGITVFVLCWKSKLRMFRV